MRKSLMPIFVAFAVLACSAVPALAEEPIVNLELDYWLPMFLGETYVPISIGYHGHDEDTDSCHDDFSPLALAPQPVWGVKASADMKLGGGRLGLDYWYTAASASVGSLDEEFDYEPYNPKNYPDQSEDDLIVWGYGYGMYDYLHASTNVSDMSAALRYILPMHQDEHTTVSFSLGVRGAKLIKSQSITLQDVDGEPAYERYREWSVYTQNILGIGPMAGVSFNSKIAERFSIYGGADASVMAGFVHNNGIWTEWEYSEFDPDLESWVYQYHDDQATFDQELVALIPSVDGNFGMAYAFGDRITVKAGVFASVMLGVPSLPEWDYDPEVWQNLGATRTTGVAGLTLGVKGSF